MDASNHSGRLRGNVPCSVVLLHPNVRDQGDLGVWSDINSVRIRQMHVLAAGSLGAALKS
jgi:hypothetical protein